MHISFGSFLSTIAYCEPVDSCLINKAAQKTRQKLSDILLDFKDSAEAVTFMNVMIPLGQILFPLSFLFQLDWYQIGSEF